MIHHLEGVITAKINVTVEYETAAKEVEILAKRLDQLIAKDPFMQEALAKLGRVDVSWGD